MDAPRVIFPRNLTRVRFSVFFFSQTLSALTQTQTNVDAQGVGAAGWEIGRPNPREKILGMRRELGRALGEWVLAVEEVMLHNERL